MLKALLDRALRHFVNNNRYSTLTNGQIEAYIDLLALAMVIDRHIAQSERDLITSILDQFDWPSPKPSEHLVNMSVRRAWLLLESDTLDADILAACRRIASRLQDEWVMESAFLSLIQVIEADSKVDDVELNLLELAAEAFGFDTQRVDHLRERAARQRAQRQTTSHDDLP